MLPLLHTTPQAPQSGPDSGCMRETCRVHIVNNTAGAPGMRQAASTLQVLQAVPIADLAVLLQVEHPDVSALEVSVHA